MVNTLFGENTSKFFTVKKHSAFVRRGITVQNMRPHWTASETTKEKNLESNLTESKLDCSVHIFLLQVGVKEAWQGKTVQLEVMKIWHDLDSVFQKLNIDFKNRKVEYWFQDGVGLC